MAPHVTRVPPLASDLIEASNVAGPTCSKITSAPPPIRLFPDAPGNVLPDEKTRVRPDLSGLGELVFRPGDGDDARADELPDLDGGRADPASRPRDDDGLARLEAGPRNKHVPGGQERERKSRRFFEGHRGGKREEVPTGTATFSAQPPGIEAPTIPNEGHRLSNPERQAGHSPHERPGATTTRSPGLKRPFPPPRLLTTPAMSHPGMCGRGVP